MNGVRLWTVVAGAHACTLLALLLFAAAQGVPSPAPLAWPGAAGMPLAWLFNALAWVGPGLVVALALWRLRARMPGAGLGGGIALRLGLLAALAFAGQGVWPLDPTALDGGASRLHAAAWMLWLLAFGAGAVLSGVAVPAVRWPALPICAACLLSPLLLGPIVGPRVVLGAWWAWTLLLVVRLPDIDKTGSQS